MKKRLILLLTGTMSLCLAACSPHSDRLDVFDIPPERQNFHWAVASEDAQKVPLFSRGRSGRLAHFTRGTHRHPGGKGISFTDTGQPAHHDRRKLYRPPHADPGAI